MRSYGRKDEQTDINRHSAGVESHLKSKALTYVPLA